MFHLVSIFQLVCVSTRNHALENFLISWAGSIFGQSFASLPPIPNTALIVFSYGR